MSLSLKVNVLFYNANKLQILSYILNEKIFFIQNEINIKNILINIYVKYVC